MILMRRPDSTSRASDGVLHWNSRISTPTCARSRPLVSRSGLAGALEEHVVCSQPRRKDHTRLDLAPRRWLAQAGSRVKGRIGASQPLHLCAAREIPDPTPADPVLITPRQRTKHVKLPAKKTQTETLSLPSPATCCLRELVARCRTAMNSNCTGVVLVFDAPFRIYLGLWGKV